MSCQKENVELLLTLWVLGRLYADKALTEPTAPWETFHVNTDRYYRVTS